MTPTEKLLFSSRLSFNTAHRFYDVCGQELGFDAELTVRAGIASKMLLDIMRDLHEAHPQTDATTT